MSVDRHAAATKLQYQLIWWVFHFILLYFVLHFQFKIHYFRIGIVASPFHYTSSTHTFYYINSIHSLQFIYSNLSAPKILLVLWYLFLFFFFSKFSLKMLSVSLSLDHTISVVVSSNFHFNDNRMAIQLSVECRRSVLLDHSHEFYEYHRDFWGSEISFLFSICSFFFIQKFVYWNMYGYIKALNRT